MFRKPKRKAPKQGLRSRREDDEHEEGKVENGGRETEEDESERNDDDDNNNNNTNTTTTTDLISEARKRLKSSSNNNSTISTTAAGRTTTTTLEKATEFSGREAFSSVVSNSDLATRTAMHLPVRSSSSSGGGGGAQNAEKEDTATTTTKSGRGADGIYRNKELNKFHAGPIKASHNIRVTARFDYQPDVCKDYKDTGFCGYGDTCIYLHDRGDTLTGWQIDQQWEDEQRKKKEQQEKVLQEFMDGGAGRKQQQSSLSSSNSTTLDDTADGLPFACHICRDYFRDPVVTTCQHYFCESCIMNHVRDQLVGGAARAAAVCPICHQDTHSVFHQPIKLVAKKKRVLGLEPSKQDDSWKQFMQVLSAAPPSGRTKTESS